MTVMVKVKKAKMTLLESTFIKAKNWSCNDKLVQSSCRYIFSHNRLALISVMAEDIFGNNFNVMMKTYKQNETSR